MLDSNLAMSEEVEVGHGNFFLGISIARNSL
jgi:hypothetical protein